MKTFPIKRLHICEDVERDERGAWSGAWVWQTRPWCPVRRRTSSRLADLPPADKPAIVIGDGEESCKAGIDAAQIPIEGFVVKTAHNRVFLVGRTRPVPAGSDRWAPWSNDGAARAVADFLERFVGVRWTWTFEAFLKEAEDAWAKAGATRWGYRRSACRVSDA